MTPCCDELERRIPEWYPVVRPGDPPVVRLVVTEREYELLMAARREELQRELDKPDG